MFSRFQDITSRSSTLLGAACLLALLLLPRPGEAQFLRISMEVESELRTQTVQTLQFGELYQNAGPVQVSMGEGNMGIYSISGNPTQWVRVTLDTPGLLRHADRSLGDSLEISIQAAYANQGANRVEDAQLFGNSEAQFQMMQSAGSLTPTQMMRDVTAYIYLFGEISVGDVEPGLYDGQIVMQVEYL